MDEAEIIRLNIERYRRMLRSEQDESVRRAIQKMLDEFETRLILAGNRPNQLGGNPG
jgi:hypothetical protein